MSAFTNTNKDVLETWSSEKNYDFSKSQTDNMDLTPDELFTKFTVSEVKALQTRLRADADAKQEELRLMVGERYRELLQASSAIISISKASKRVLEAIGESKESILSQDNLPLQLNSTAKSDTDNKHLANLQILSTHIKLLLDTPEHLWRLIERRQYLHAAWLFLLSRVAYRALVTHDEDDQSWEKEGLEMDRDFPLVQRQWDIVSQFRSQIIHKSTLSLREMSMSTEDICAALVCLHLLDSRPLNEILNTFLQQRLKKLQAVLSWKLHAKPNNGDGSPISSARVGVGVREVTKVMKDSLITILQTACTSRAIFNAQPDCPPLLLRVLDSIQSESNDFEQVPSNLRVSALTVLGLLTSSATLQLLPPDIRSYRPYVDLNACSTSLTQPVFSQNLQEWFHDSCEKWKACSSMLLSGLNSVKDVWVLQTSIKKLVSTSNLSEEEKGHLSSDMDTLCHDQILAIWNSKLAHAEDEFKLRLRSQVSENADFNQSFSMSDFLFTPTQISSLSQSKASADTAFHKYQLVLKRQLVGRSPQLDSILSILDDCARTVQLDFLTINGYDEKHINPFVDKLEQIYQPAANNLSCKVADTVEELIIDLVNGHNSNPYGFVLLSRVIDGLHSSSFIDRIRCSNEAIQGFKKRAISIADRAVEEWRNAVVKRIVDELKLNYQISPANGPSHALLQALLVLSEELRNLATVYNSVRQRFIVQDVFRQFCSAFLDGPFDEADETILNDLVFLRVLCELYGPTWNDISTQINEKLKSAPSDKLTEIESLASEHLARSQTLLSIFLPLPALPNFDAPLLQFGSPAAGQNYTFTTDLAKPGSRFGMLLVGKAEARTNRHFLSHLRQSSL